MAATGVLGPARSRSPRRWQPAPAAILAGLLAARPAAAHHAAGGDAGGSWLWLFLGVLCLLAGVAAWAFSGERGDRPAGPPGDGDGAGAGER